MTHSGPLNTTHARPVQRAPQRRFVLLLLGSFSPLDLASAISALEAANARLGGAPYGWRILSESGEMLRAANGIAVAPDGGLDPAARDDTVIVLGGDKPEQDCTPAVLSWLRGATRQGCAIAGVSGGTWALARAGLLNGVRVTTHWSLRSALAERWPDLEIDQGLFHIDGSRITCAGGAATLDLMVQLIAQDHGASVASDVSDRLVSAAPRGGDQAQAIPEHCRTGVRHEKLAAALRLMRAELETPLPLSHVAERVGLSNRQLERLFSKHLNVTPKVYYTRLRLENARALLKQTDMRIIEVGLASGFTSQSHFSRTYRKLFGISPNAERSFAAR